MIGRLLNDLWGRNPDQETKAILWVKSASKNHGTGGILLAAAQALKEVPPSPEGEESKMPVQPADDFQVLVASKVHRLVRLNYLQG